MADVAGIEPDAAFATALLWADVIVKHRPPAFGIRITATPRAPGGPWEPAPLKAFVSMLRMTGCRQPAMRAGRKRPCPWDIRSRHSPRRSIGTQRTCAGRSRAPASAAHSRMLQGEADDLKTFRGMKIPFERHRQNAPGWEPEGVRLGLGRSG